GVPAVPNFVTASAVPNSVTSGQAAATHPVGNIASGFPPAAAQSKRYPHEQAMDFALVYAGTVCDADARFVAPASVVALFRSALHAFAPYGEPRWRAFERLLAAVVAEWERQPRHRDPVFARDGWRCTVPGCSARGPLQDHHLL